MLLEEDTPAETYNVEVECDIRPSSTADYCEVIVCNDDSTLSGITYVIMYMYICSTYSIYMQGECLQLSVEVFICDTLYSVSYSTIVTVQ